MTQDNPFTEAPKKRGRPKTVKASPEAESIFNDITPIPSSERKVQTEYDVDDLFADIDELDLRRKAEISQIVDSPNNITQNSPYSKKTNVNDEDVPNGHEVAQQERNNPGSPKLNNVALEEMKRAEEIAAELRKSSGIFIEGVDNAKPGVPFRAVEADVHSPEFPLPHADQRYVRADGIVLDGIGVFDTGDGAQSSEAMPAPNDRDDPASPHYMVCVNKNCRYREGCMRYRMHNKRDMKTVFFPDTCREDGIYQNIDGNTYEAYDPMHILESNATPSF